MIVAGIGLRRDATIDSLMSALAQANAEGIEAAATPADKADHPALVALAAELGVKIIKVSQADLEAQTTYTQSKRVHEMRGTGSVAEAAALAATHGTLLTPRVVSDDRMATCAIAQGDDQ